MSDCNGCRCHNLLAGTRGLAFTLALTLLPPAAVVTWIVREQAESAKELSAVSGRVSTLEGHQQIDSVRERATEAGEEAKRANERLDKLEERVERK